MKLKAIIAALFAMFMVMLPAGQAQATTYVKGTVINGTSHTIYTSSTYPSWTDYGPYLYYGQSRSGVASFQCRYTCISQWGYKYPTGSVVGMTTTGDLYLHD
jgi:hypothetical protein